MTRTAWIAVLVVALAGSVAAQRGRARGPQGAPNIDGLWTGTWSSYSPARASTPPQEQCAKLSANITKKGDLWQAVFEGDCGRPYKYTITMDGRLVDGVVMFKGSVDLGAQDGGVYDWIGRAVESDFVGFYTSAASTGVFSLTRSK